MKIQLQSLIMIFLAVTVQARDAGYLFEEVRGLEENGINNIGDIIQDEKGFIWLTGPGLTRFDGMKFRKFVHEPFCSNCPSTNELIDMVIDKKGNMWIGSMEGINFFEPRTERFTRIKVGGQDEQSRQPRISQLEIDSSNVLWINTFDDKLYLLDLDEFYRSDSSHFEYLVHESEFSAVETLYIDRDGNVFIRKGTTLYVLPAGLMPVKSNLVHIILRDTDGNVMRARSIGFSQDPYGNYWLGNSGGLIFMQRDFLGDLTGEDSVRATVRRYELSVFWDSPGIRIDEIFTNRNEIWFATYIHGGVHSAKYDSAGNISSPVHYRNLEDPGGEPVVGFKWNIYEDRSGNLWITNSDGKSYIRHKIEPWYRGVSYEDQIEDVNPTENIINISESSDGTLWLSTNLAGLYSYNRKTDQFTHYPTGYFTQHFISHLDRHGNLWFGGWLYLMAGHMRRIKDRDTLLDISYIPLPQTDVYKHNIYSIFECDSGLWIGADNCLYFIGNTASFQSGSPDALVYRVYPLDSLKYAMNFVHDITSNEYFSKRGWLLAGSNKGLYFFNTWSGKLVSLRYDPLNPRGLNHDLIMDIQFVGDDEIWLATAGGGLNKMKIYREEWPEIASMLILDSDTLYYAVDHYTTKKGLPDNEIAAVQYDPEGFLWLNTPTSFARFSLAKEEFVCYYKINGYEMGGISRICRTSGDELIFGTRQLNIVRPDMMGDAESGTRMVLTDIQLENHSLSPVEESLIDQAVPWTRTLKIPFKKNSSLTLEYASLDFQSPVNNIYKYRLQGFRDDWVVTAADERTASFTHLSPGKYRFEALGSNSQGIWGKEPVTLEIRIEPPWYRSTMAWIFYAVFFASAPFAFVRVRTRQLEAEKRKLEARVAERTVVIENQKEEILASNELLEHQKEELIQQKEEVTSANEELERQKEELQVALDHLRETQEQLIQAEKLASLGGLVAGVAHEINTPVGISVTAASSLAEETNQMAEKYKQNKISRSEFKDYLNTANQSAQLILSNMEKAATMIQSFKQVSVDQSTEQKRRFNLKEYSEDVIRSLYPKLKEKKLDIRIDMDEDLVLDSYPGAFSQIITNLVLNSLVHGFDGNSEGAIKLSAVSQKSSLQLEYWDNGKGIPVKLMDKIFDPFFTTDKKAGTGLGLHIVYNLVIQKLNGSITCDSKEGEGTTFRIELPL